MRPQILTGDTERQVAIEYACGVPLYYIGRQFSGNQLDIFTAMRNQAAQDGLVSFYRGMPQPHREDRSAAHLYLALEGRPVPAANLVMPPDGFARDAVVNTVFMPHIKPVIGGLGLEELVKPMLSEEHLLADIYGDFDATTIVMNVFTDVLYSRLQRDEHGIRLAFVDVHNELLSRIKNGWFSMSEVKKELLYKVVPVVSGKYYLTLARWYGLSSSTTPPFPEQQGKLKIPCDADFLHDPDMRRERVRALRLLRGKEEASCLKLLLPGRMGNKKARDILLAQESGEEVQAC